MNATPALQLKLELDDEAATRQFAADVAMSVSKGGTLFLEGDLGAGKSCFARAFIRQISGDDHLEVPSPTFSIVQHYEFSPHSIVTEVIHADLYRLNDPGEVEELGLTSLDEQTIALIEWPEKGQGSMGIPALHLKFETLREGEADEGRSVSVSGQYDWLNSLNRSLTIRRFVTEGWAENVSRRPLMGDASSRSYEIVTLDNQQRILMNAPRQPDGPIIQDGKPYSQIAKLAESISAFVGVDKILDDLGLRVPQLFHHDLQKGLILLEDLGEGKIIDEARKPIVERYLASGELLAEFHSKEHYSTIQLTDHKSHTIPNYDREAMLIEVDLLAKWYAPRFKGASLSDEEYAAFSQIWNDLVDQLSDSEIKIALRDYHSPNIIWREQEIGANKVGVIDFQDAVMGPSAYD
ncbi:MAG: tRNA (adenosine(37)-N6)-threonylcarbamoyltransferase complex ATPase subunit type 1 TsaE, partial [Salaquimonas sp.]